MDMAVANTFIAQVLFLESINPEKDISIYINSYGGEVYSGLAMYDVIKHVNNPVCTINVGLAASAASILLASGTRGKRYALPNSYCMIHQPLGSLPEYKQATEIEIKAKHLIKLKYQFAEIIAKETGKNVEDTIKDMERDNWMDAETTRSYGIIDQILIPQNPK
jgi:ATP-dependent Clp protease protease subunit